MNYVRMYRLAYSTPRGEFGTFIAIAPPNEVWPSIVTVAGWDNAARIVRQKSDGTLLAITPISDGVS